MKEQQENQQYLPVEQEVCDYGVPHAECLLDESLTNWFLYQTAQVWVGIVLFAFQNIIGNGGGWGAVWQNEVSPVAVELLNKGLHILQLLSFSSPLLEKSLDYAICTSWN